MPAARPGISALSDGPVPARPSAEACVVCGHHALTDNAPSEFTVAVTGRRFCTVCGAHRVEHASTPLT